MTEQVLSGSTSRRGPGESELVTIGSVHQNIQEGIFYSVQSHDKMLADGASVDVLFRVVSGAHTRMLISLGGDGIFQIFENMTASNDGVSHIGVNRNRFRAASNVALNLVFDDPVITSVGDPVAEYLIIGGRGPNAPGGDAGFFFEWLLSNTDHLIRLTNESGQPQRGQISLDWYEKPNSGV